jgi:hypothetical protein
VYAFEGNFVLSVKIEVGALRGKCGVARKTLVAGFEMKAGVDLGGRAFRAGTCRKGATESPNKPS